MKIIRNNKVYIQKGDIIDILNLSQMIYKDGVLDRIFLKMIKCDWEEGLQFVEFDEPQIIEFFSNQDYIIDYDEVKDLSVNEIKELANSIKEDLKNIPIKYHELGNEKINCMCKAKRIKLNGIDNYLWYKTSLSSFELPYGIDEPEKVSIKSVLKKVLKKNTDE